MFALTMQLLRMNSPIRPLEQIPDAFLFGFFRNRIAFPGNQPGAFPSEMMQGHSAEHGARDVSLEYKRCGI
jgi:hypothetical protein